jgi:hypothetical protein
VGSVLSIGSVASFASLGSLASAMSTMSVGSFQAGASVLSGQSDGSILSWQSSHALRGRREDGRVDPTVVGPAAAAATVVAGIAWLAVRRRGERNAATRP